MGLLVYFMIGAFIAYTQIRNADEMHEEGVLDDEDYMILRDRKPFAFSVITMFWLPSIIDNIRRNKHD